MRIHVLALVATLAALPLVGCGVSLPFGTTVSTPSLTGNWQIQSVSVTNVANSGVLLLGALTSQGSQVTGTFRFQNLTPGNTCGLLPQTVSVTGAIDATGAITLTSASFSGSIIKIKLTVPAAIGSFGAGTIEVDGGTCSYASSAAIGNQIAPVTGTYTGSFTPAPIQGNPATGTATGTLVLAQSSTPAADGQFPVTGTLQFAGTSCTTSTAISGTISGLGITLASPVTGIIPFSNTHLNGAVDPTAASFLDLGVIFAVPPCAVGLVPAAYTGTPKRQ